MRKTFKELQEVDVLVGELYKKLPGLKNSKFGYAYGRFYDKNIAPLVKEFQDEAAYIQIDNALEGPDKALLLEEKDPTRYKYSKEGRKKSLKEQSLLLATFEAKEVEIIPYISSTVPDGLLDEQKELLTGLVI